MNLTINGDKRKLPLTAPLTVIDLLTHLTLSPHSNMVELNEKIIPKPQFSTQKIREEDRIEIVRFMGGG